MLHVRRDAMRRMALLRWRYRRRMAWNPLATVAMRRDRALRRLCAWLSCLLRAPRLRIDLRGAKWLLLVGLFVAAAGLNWVYCFCGTDEPSLADRAPDIVLRRAAMLLDELARIDPAARVLAIARTDERRDELAHLEMQMRPDTGRPRFRRSRSARRGGRPAAAPRASRRHGRRRTARICACRSPRRRAGR